MKTLVLAGLAVLASVAACSAGEPLAPPAGGLLVPADWQAPQALPRRFRNHCAYDQLSGRRYCSDHCGHPYQFYFCSGSSFGCCRIGFGYCDWRGLLRCRP